MKDDQAYPKTEELANQLSDRLQKLSDGKLKLAELDELTQMSRELYERMVVLRYKTMDTEEETPSAPPPAPSIKFKVDKGVVSENQTSLIDAIEEIDSEVKTSALEEKPNLSVESMPVEADVIKEDGPLTVAEKLNGAPIDSIKAEIGLNQKFRFINELFDGDAEAYGTAIDQLDGATDLNSAVVLFNQAKADQNWDEEEEEVTQQLMQLIERRHG